VKYANTVTLDRRNLERLQWFDLNKSEIKLIDLQRSSIWRQMFIDFRAELKNIKGDPLVGSTLKIARNED
jgi:hypothetical protein